MLKEHTREATVKAVIVNYFKADRMADSIRSLRKQNIDVEIVVVDNSVDDHQRMKIDKADISAEAIMYSTNNLGYARAVNAGAALGGDADYILLVSPDIIVDDPNVVADLVAKMEMDDSIGIIAPLQKNDDGSIVEIARTFPSPIKQILRRVVPGRLSELDLLRPLTEGSSTIEVDWIQSSFVMVRSSLWKELGGLDEDYFVFMADIDLCRAVWSLKRRVTVTASSSARADGIRSSNGSLYSLLTNKALRIHVKDAIRYYYKNIGRPVLRSGFGGPRPDKR